MKEILPKHDELSRLTVGVIFNKHNNLIICFSLYSREQAVRPEEFPGQSDGRGRAGVRCRSSEQILTSDWSKYNNAVFSLVKCYLFTFPIPKWWQVWWHQRTGSHQSHSWYRFQADDTNQLMQTKHQQQCFVQSIWMSEGLDTKFFFITP